MASLWASAGAHNGAPKLTVNTVRGEAVGGRRLALGDIPSPLVGEGVGGRERGGEGERVGAAGRGATRMRMGPWNRRAHSSRSGSGSVAKSSYCPRRMGGSSVDC